MDNMSEKKSIKDKVLSEIRKGKAVMKPKWHFILKTVLMATGAFIVAFMLLYLSSFVLFALRQTGVLFVPLFGLRGLRTFFMSLPWLIILAAVIFVIILEVLVRRYSFAYRKPLLYSVGIIVLLVFLGSIFVSNIGVHQEMMKYAKERKLPFGGALYREFGAKKLPDVCRCIITSVGDNKIIVKDDDGKEYVVEIAPETRFPFGTDFGEGERVIVFGERDGANIRAFGILKVDEGEENFSPRGRRGFFGPSRRGAF